MSAALCRLGTQRRHQVEPGHVARARQRLRLARPLFLGGRRIREAVLPRRGSVGDVGYYSLVYGYRPPFLRLDYPKPDLRFFVEAQGEWQRSPRSGGLPDLNTGGQILLVGPTTLLLYKQYGLEGGILLPVYQQPNGAAARALSRGRQCHLFLLASVTWRSMRTISAAVLALLLLAPATAMAELRHVQLNVLGMD